MVLSVGVLKIFETLGVLCFGAVVGEVPIGCAPEFFLVGDKACLDVGLIAYILRTIEEMAEGILAEVACVLEYDVEDNF